jgi:hypothetical protein
MLLGLCLVLVPSTPALGQRWRTLDASRQLREATPISVRVEYAAGKLDLKPSASHVLYRVNLRYDAERTEPLVRYDTAARSLAIGLRPHGGKRRHRNPNENTMVAELSRELPMDLALELGAAQGDLLLGGLRLRRLYLKGGAADLNLDFDQPNPERIGTFGLDVGAADVTVRRGGNARADAIHVNVGAGALDYDLTGEWTGDVDVSANIAVGNFTLRVPPDAGVQLSARTFLVSFAKAGLQKRGDAWYSPGYERAGRRVRVNLNAAIGEFELIRR